MQVATENVPVSKEVKTELVRRKEALSKQKGRRVNFDYVMRKMLGWL